jgi:hypothetical protein
MRCIFLTVISGLILSFSACVPSASVPDEGQVLDIVWEALEPNTSSHNRSVWEVVEVRSVTGDETQEMFEGEPVPGNCAPGPRPPDNATITNDDSYWYVLMSPIHVTAEPPPTEQFSPTAPPNIPEPFLYQAHFLVDARNGEVIARKLDCVIY